MKLEYPKITGTNTAQQIKQLQSWLYTLVEAVNLEGAQHTATQSLSQTGKLLGGTGAEAAEGLQVSPTGSFNAIKSLIIKSAEIVEAYTLAIGDGLVGRYAAEANFPEGSYQFCQDTSSYISRSSTDITALFQNYQSILSDVQGVQEQLIHTDAYIKAGELFTADADFVELMELPEEELEAGMPVYGVAVGQTTNGFQAMARFTPYGLLLYDDQDRVVAYFTRQEMRIRRVRILESLQRGGFLEKILSDGSTVEKWIG